MKRDPRVVAYIDKAQPFAKPVLKHLRKLVHKGCSEVTETIKWGMPSFEYKGTLCSMASFKQHAVFGFAKAALLTDPHGYLQKHKAQGGDAMGNLGRLTSLKDLPPDDILIDFIEQAQKLNDSNIKPKTEKAPLVVPDYVTAALAKNNKAKATFDSLAYSHRKEYLQWITEAKTEATRQKRLASSVEWLAEGKNRNWKYAGK